ETDGADGDPGLADGEGGPGGLEVLVTGLLERTEITRALEACWGAGRGLHRYVEERKPWELARDEGRAEELDAALYNLAEGLRVVTLLLLAYVPHSGEPLPSARRA